MGNLLSYNYYFPPVTKESICASCGTDLIGVVWSCTECNNHYCNKTEISCQKEGKPHCEYCNIYWCVECYFKHDKFGYGLCPQCNRPTVWNNYSLILDNDNDF